MSDSMGALAPRNRYRISVAVRCGYVPLTFFGSTAQFAYTKQTDFKVWLSFL